MEEKSKITSAAIEKMIDFYQGNLRDIEHFLKVWAYAKTIGEQESVDANTQAILELAAVVHDISCPLCREKYGNTNGKNQELESEPLVKEFFEDLPVSEQKVERIVWLVTHHHTYTNIDGMDYQILVEADFLVNASESNYSRESIEGAKEMLLVEDVDSKEYLAGLFNAMYDELPVQKANINRRKICRNIKIWN